MHAYQKSPERIESSSSDSTEHEKEVSEEPNCDIDENQLEEEQEEETGEVTTNQLF
jgi:hypothetical protein